MTLEKEKRFLLLLSSFMQVEPATKKNVLDYIEAQGWIRLTAADRRIKENIHEAVWRNNLAFVRKHLSMAGCFAAGIRNDWSITPKGEQALFALFQEAQGCPAFEKITPAALSAASGLFSAEAIGALIPSDEFAEGRASYRQHIVRERNRELIETAKATFMAEHSGRLYCEVCGFDFFETYGSLGEDFIEAHHTKPVSAMQEGEKTKIEDIVMVCSNCHSMIHRRKPWLHADALKTILTGR